MEGETKGGHDDDEGEGRRKMKFDQSRIRLMKFPAWVDELRMRKVAEIVRDHVRVRPPSEDDGIFDDDDLNNFGEIDEETLKRWNATTS